MTKSILITGSSGLVGSETALFFDRMGWDVHGVDNNMRREFFGPDGDTSVTLERVLRLTRHYTHHDQDLRDRPAVLGLMGEIRPRAIIHCASQPSHDLAKDRPF